MSFSDYLALDAVNVSSLKNMAKSPLHYHHGLTCPRKETAALRLGTATHVAILEPARFLEEYAAEPDFGDCRLKANKSERDNWRNANMTKTQVSFADHTRLLAMSEAVHAHPEAARLLREGQPEVSLSWTDPETGLACKGRVDWVGPGYILGLKTTRSNDFRMFQSAVENYGYLWQWAWYQWGWYVIYGENLDMYEIAVESDAPHDVVCYQIPQPVLDIGLEEARELLRTVAECRRANYWPGRAPEIVKFRRAPWAGFEQKQDIDLDGLEEIEDEL